MQKYKLYPRIRDCREDYDMTQEQIAKILCMGTTQYRRYELAESPVSFELMEKLANYYNISLDYIAGRTNDKRGLTRSELSDEETELIKKFRSLSESGKGRILERMDMIEQEESEEISRFKEVG